MSADQDTSLKSKTLKNFFWNGTSNLVLQLSALAFGILINRLLNPEAIGIVGLLSIFTVVATSIQESGFITALINRKQFDLQDYNSVFWFNIFTGITLYTVLFLCAPLIAGFYERPELIPLARYCFIAIIFSSFSVAQNAYLWKSQQIKIRGLASILASVIANSLGIVLVLYGFGYWGFASINVAYQFVVMICFWLFSSYRPQFKWSLQPIKEMAPFSINVLITNIFSQITAQIFSVILGKYYLTKDVGNYTQGYKWATTSQSMITGMLNNVTQVLISEIRDSRERLERIYIKLFETTCFIAFPSMFILSICSKDFITIFLTEKWSESAYYLQNLTFLSPFIILSLLHTQLLLSLGKSNIYRTITIIQSITQILVLICIYPMGTKPMLYSFIIISILTYFAWHYFACSRAHISSSRIIIILSKYLIITGPLVLLVSYLGTKLISNIYFRFSFMGILSILLYLLLMFILKSKVQSEIFSHLKQRLPILKKKHQKESSGK